MKSNVVVATVEYIYKQGRCCDGESKLLDIAGTKTSTVAVASAACEKYITSIEQKYKQKSDDG